MWQRVERVSSNTKEGMRIHQTSRPFESRTRLILWISRNVCVISCEVGHPAGAGDGVLPRAYHDDIVINHNEPLTDFMRILYKMAPIATTIRMISSNSQGTPFGRAEQQAFTLWAHCWSDRARRCWSSAAILFSRRFRVSSHSSLMAPGSAMSLFR